MSGVEPLRLLAVTHYPPMVGGSSRSCALLFDGIARRGHRVHVLGPITPEAAGFDDLDRAGRPCGLSVSRYELSEISLIQFDTASFLDQQAREHDAIRRRLPGLIDRLRPDVVVAAHETLGAAVIDVAHARGRPCALLLRGSPTWQIASGRYPEALGRRYLDLYRAADLVIPVSRHMEAFLSGQGVERMRHIPNLLDLQRFAPGPPPAGLRAALGIPPGGFVVLHPSTMVSRKRAEDILRAAELTSTEVPEAFFVFAGGEHRAAELERAARRGAVADRVRFVPLVPYAEMPAFFRLADLVVMASDGEGMSRVYLEAQACGRTLVASDIPPAREVIEHGRTGLLFRQGDVADLARRIIEAASDAGLRARLGRAARERVAPHAVDIVVDRYVEAFRGLSAARAAAARAPRLPGTARESGTP